MSSAGKIEFISNKIPALLSGSYNISLRHVLDYAATSVFEKIHRFHVQSERFTINPQEILKQFPSPNISGTFDNVLPHVIFSRPSLPWERTPQPPGQAPWSEPHSWLAIMVFPAYNAPESVIGTLADLCPAPTLGPSSSQSALPSGIYSYGSVYPSIDDFLEVGETPATSCTYIDLPIRQFAAIAPCQEDLRWVAHVRSKVRVDEDFSTFYSVVVANSLPTPGMGAVAHIVSLEGLADQLPEADGTYKTAPDWATIRLVSLASWRFVVAPLEASFSAMLLGLNNGIIVPTAIAPETVELGDSQVRLPAGVLPDAAPQDAPTAPFNAGYTVLSGTDPQPQPAAWYRGPLLPSTLTPAAADAAWAQPLLPAIHAASLAMTVDATPTQDLSYASAWQLGRLLALADKNFATEQVSWKRDIRLTLNTALGQQNRLGSGSRAGYAELVRAVVKDPEKIRSVLGASLSTDGAADTLAIPQSLVDWLARLTQLQLVPFPYLLPDSRMAPAETLRFFSVDQRWIACLLDGAWSLGRQPASGWGFDTAYQPWQQLLAGTLLPSFAVNGSFWPATGALLNSQIIPGYWPGIQFETDPIANVVREDLLGPITLLLLLDRPITSLTCKQPSEGIHFGFDMDEAGQLSKQLRYVKIDGTFYPAPKKPDPVIGQEVADLILTSIPQRSATVIQLDELASAISDALKLLPGSSLMPVDLAVELVESMTSVRFDLPVATEG